MLLKDIIEDFVAKNKRRDKKLADYRKQITDLEKKIERMYSFGWIINLVEPIAKEILKKLPKYEYVILGPFGLSSEVGVHFYKKGIDHDSQYSDKKGGVLCISFRPINISKGEIVLVDNCHTTTEFKQGTLGEVNGFNYQTVHMKKTMKELMQFFYEQNENKSLPDVKKVGI